MRQRIKYVIVFAVLLIAEILIGLFAKGFIRGFAGDVLVIPTIYFLLRIIFSKDSIFSVYVLPLLCYSMGKTAELLQLMDIGGMLGISGDSLAGILIGGTCDVKDLLAYLIGLYLIGIFLAFEGKSRGRKWWYPISVFIHWTWGFYQTFAGFIVYLWYIRCPHTYYGEVVRTEWPLEMGLSLGFFIFTPCGSLSEDMAVHEYGHTFQSVLLGPLYVIVIGIPSLAWGLTPYFRKLRDRKGIRYTDLFCERWASDWGEKVTGKKALRT